MIAFLKSVRPIVLLPDAAMRTLFGGMRRCGRVLRGVAAWSLVLFLILEKRTMLSQKRLWNLYTICSSRSLPEGSFVECGVARGGGVAMLSLAAHGKRKVWGFDSFDAMPPLTAEDRGSGGEWVGQCCSGAHGKQEAERTLRRFNLNDDNVRLVAGWFEETLARHVDRMAPIAVLRLDGDWYAATRYCLECCYDHVRPGGVVLIDDYGTFLGCKKAVDEFRAQRNINAPLIATEHGTEVYWYKSEDSEEVRCAA